MWKFSRESGIWARSSYTLGDFVEELCGDDKGDRNDSGEVRGAAEGENGFVGVGVTGRLASASGGVRRGLLLGRINGLASVAKA